MMCCGVKSVFVKIFQCAGCLTTINNRRFQLVFIKSFSRVAVPVPVYSINTLITAPGHCAGMKHGLQWSPHKWLLFRNLTTYRIPHHFRLHIQKVLSIHTFRMGALEKSYTLSVETYGLCEVYGFEMVFVEMKYLLSARFILQLCVGYYWTLVNK